MNLVDVLQRHAREIPTRVAYRFVAPDGNEAATLTYGELAERVVATALLIHARAAPGERALLLYPAGLDFVVAFWACLTSGVIAVPAFPPEPQRLGVARRRLASILADASASLILTTTAGATLGRALLPELATAAPLLTTDGAPASGRPLASPEYATGSLRRTRRTAGSPLCTLADDTVALLQYTSGSTSEPRGVMVTHGNLVANERMIAQAFGHDAHMVGVSWLPQYHDMGLLGGVLQPCFLGAEAILLAPEAFLTRPRLWLETISRYRATSSGAPNFAYDLCVQRIAPEERAGLDLSSWRVAFNGAEPVRTDTLERFAEHFAPCGFAATALYPCYGLAEATLLVTGGEIGKPPRRALRPGRAAENRHELVSCGRAQLGGGVTIASPETHTACLDGEIGEIWVRGPHVAAGYFNNPKATRAVFGARVRGATKSRRANADAGTDAGTGANTDADVGAEEKTQTDGRYLRTGDLGFVWEGELYVVGRHKDLIIVRGVNYHPADLEHDASRSHASLRRGAAAAFAVTRDGREQVVLVQAVRAKIVLSVPAGEPTLVDLRHGRLGGQAPGTHDAREIIAAIRRALLDEHGLELDTVILVEPDGVPKTSSGKVQRFRARELFVADGLQAICRWQLPRAADSKSSADRAPASLPPRCEGRPPRTEDIAGFLVAWLTGRAHVPVETIRPHEPFSVYGLDSLRVLELLGALEKWLNRTVATRTLLDHPSVDSLSSHLADVYTQLAPLERIICAAPLSSADAKRLLAESDGQSDEDFAAALRSGPKSPKKGTF